MNIASVFKLVRSILPTLLLSAGIGAAVGACTGDDGGSCLTGSHGCPCDANFQCLAGLTCNISVGGSVCVPDGGDGDGDSTTGDPTGDGDGDGDCKASLTSCNGTCVNLETSNDHCGACNSPCEGAGVCDNGQCTTITDCTMQACPGFSYCDLTSKQCLPGCAFDSQCDDGFVCNLVSHTCGCADDEQLCNDVCIPDWEECQTCGNGIIEGSEECDGAALGGQSCMSFGYLSGTLSCTNCSFNTANCTNDVPMCGNGVIDPGEDCDGVQLGGATCTSLGYQSGTLSCSNCSFSTLSCFPYSGDCCLSSATAGCNQPSVVQCVCALDAYCCNTAWDSACVGVATNSCSAC